MSYWWTKKWGKEHICSISYKKLRPGKNKNGIKYTTTLPCKHRFNTNSLLEWMKVSNNYSCPICRTNFGLIDIINDTNK